jgi:lipopolysaccharide export system protein LptC
MPINDITPRDRSIRNIPLPNTPVRRGAPPPQQPPNRPNTGLPPHVALPPKRRSRLWLWIIIVVVLCGVGGVLLSTVFEHATVTVTPKSVAVQVPATLTASPNGPSGILIYQTLSAHESASTSVAANGTQHVSRPATGVVTLFNDYSVAPQSLTATTRLTTADGKIYRLKDAIKIPGATKKSDGTLSPSSVTASVYADKPGPAYNTTAAISLSILGFKGDPRYTKFPIQSQGAMTGGFIGDEPAVAPADLANAQDQLKRSIDDSIRSAALTQIPDGYVAVNGSLGVTYNGLVQTPGPNNTVILSQSSTATLAMVRSNDLAFALAKQTVTGYNGESVVFSDPSAVTLSLAQTSSASSTTITGPLSLKVGGEPTLVWQFDANTLAQALLGKPKSQFEGIVNTFQPAVARAQATIRPFWKGTFPTDASKLTVTVAELSP